MGENSAIEWTTHTFNPWWGCTKVSPGCAHCYAETLDRRLGGKHWGKGAPRKPASPKMWGEPLKWNEAAQRAGTRARVFCASMADWCDDEAPAGAVARLFATIQATPHLDWLLLTKRPERIRDLLPITWGKGWPNVWLGTTVEDQERANQRIPHLLNVPARVHFLSCEPLLGPVDLENLLLDGEEACATCGKVPTFSALSASATCPCCSEGAEPIDWAPIDWVIVGGESGQQARPMHPAWARALRDQCQEHGVAFFFKQWGEWAPYYNPAHFTHCGEERRAHKWLLPNGDGGDCWVIDEDGNWSNWTGEPPPATLAEAKGIAVFGHHGKGAAGRQLGGRTWDEVPTPPDVKA